MQDEILAFLEKITDDFRKNTLSEDDKKLLTEFFLSYQHSKTCINENNILDNLSHKEVLKYFFLGWYIYNKNDAETNETNETNETP